jgi:hypothetical protein
MGPEVGVVVFIYSFSSCTSTFKLLAVLESNNMNGTLRAVVHKMYVWYYSNTLRLKGRNLVQEVFAVSVLATQTRHSSHRLLIMCLEHRTPALH